MFEALLLFLVGLLGGALPLFRRWSERQLHGSLAFSTGILLGAVFFHLLPSISSDAPQAVPAPASALIEHVHEPGEEHDHDHDDDAHADPHGHAHGAVLPWFFVLVGVLGVYLVEALVLRTHDFDEQHRHRAVSFATLTGLSLHCFTAGVSYPAIEAAMGGVSALFLIAFLLHKGLEAFSLTTVFQLAGFPNKKVALMVVLFSLVTPAGILVGHLLSGTLSDASMSFFSALAAGTFLFVCLCELLPEVFHHREDSLMKIALLALGIGGILMLHEVGV